MITSLLATMIFFASLFAGDGFSDVSAKSQLAEVGATGGANYGGDWGSGSSDSDVGPVGDPGFGPTGSYDGGGQAQGGGPSGEPSGGVGVPTVAVVLGMDPMVVGAVIQATTPLARVRPPTLWEDKLTRLVTNHLEQPHKLPKMLLI